MAKIALVTVSASNIGKSIAEVLSRDGYHVTITSRNEAGQNAGPFVIFSWPFVDFLGLEPLSSPWGRTKLTGWN